MGGRAEGLACADLGARTPIGVRGNFFFCCYMSDMNSEGLGEIFEGDSADMCAGKFPLLSIGGRAEGLACADPGVRTPIGASGNLILFCY